MPQIDDIIERMSQFMLEEPSGKFTVGGWYKAFREMAKMAIARHTGARGLRAEMEQVMREIMFTAPRSSVQGKGVVVTQEMVKNVA